MFSLVDNLEFEDTKTRKDCFVWDNEFGGVVRSLFFLGITGAKAVVNFELAL